MTHDLPFGLICPECYHDMFDEFWCGECDFGGIGLCDHAMKRSISRITEQEKEAAIKRGIAVLDKYMNNKLTFAQICPQWDAVLQTGKINRRLNMQEWGKCIVGEARLFKETNVANCVECTVLGHGFMYCTKGKQRIKIIYPEVFNNRKKELVAHMKDEHADDIIRK